MAQIGRSAARRQDYGNRNKKVGKDYKRKIRTMLESELTVVMVVHHKSNRCMGDVSFDSALFLRRKIIELLSLDGRTRNLLAILTFK